MSELKPSLKQGTTKKEKLMEEKNRKLLASALKGVSQIDEDPLVCLVQKAVQTVHEDPMYRDSPLGVYAQFMSSLGSIGNNVSEGYGKVDTQDNIKFLKISRGSAYETYFCASLFDSVVALEAVEEICNYLDNRIVEYLTTD